MRLSLICDSCGKEMRLDEKIYEKHIKENHPTKIKVKEMWFNATIKRCLK